MSDVVNLDSWVDVAGLAIVTIGTVAAAVLPVWLKLLKIDDQVSNNHEENFRDEVTQGFKDVRTDIRGLAEELRTERLERIEGDRRREVL